MIDDSICQEANWYKPALGEPYRPLLALPQQIRNLDPFFKDCTDGYFTGYDPPRTLEPATAMAAPVTTRVPITSSATAAPGFAKDPGPSKTAQIKHDHGQEPFTEASSLNAPARVLAGLNFGNPLEFHRSGRTSR